MKRILLNRFLNIFFPETCPVCQGPAREHKTAPICSGCWEGISPYEGPSCRRCGKPLVSDVATICGECLQDEPAFTKAVSFGLYEGVLKKAISLLKFYGMKRLSKPLSDIILQIELPQADAVVPVPLNEKRLRQREFNQSALLAKNLAESRGIPVVLNCLVRTRDTRQQVGLNSRDRRKNIKKAFDVKQKELIAGKNIMLVDDVVTTGATVRECARVLKKAGVENIYVITLAHGMME
ncbi:MAG: ComF family protein [Nitrospiraceae bacterium]|nr:MAG: ComF family protein [Nitrospiraceae bacterium]